MILFNTRLEFLPASGIIKALSSGLFFDDTFLTNPIPLSESGTLFSPGGPVTGLSATFRALSIVGALNELKNNILSVSGSPFNGVQQLNGLSGFVTIVSPSGSISIRPDAASSQLRLDVDLISSGVVRGFSAELLPPDAQFTITHNLNTRNIVATVWDHNPYYNDANLVIVNYKPLNNNQVLIQFDTDTPTSGFVVIHGGPIR